ncbi:Protein root UVB sensitive 6 [Dichanthelium oligosanthes]|uniref:Protein root UVB sensitive 6 n=1 Tax=Dichanthelium oligosanthes TaxID=888268 RepID=A0A1E5W1W1_9POAL|nr:Protein root UVB sensitive 6 [Dichanthelium oligosanthes]
MAPVMGLKRPAAAAAAQTVTLPAPAVRDAVRAAVREAEATAQATAPAARVPAPAAVPAEIARDGVLCLEEVDGRRWSYVVDAAGAAVKAKGRASVGAAFKAVPLQSPLPPVEEIMSFIRSYVVPEGFPDSVTPSYVPYMSWRALKHFFGGAMGVFTTRTLLNSVGVSQSRAVPGAVAINWILKATLFSDSYIALLLQDGAGRVGKMLFARQGKKFDYDLKQLRFSGDLLMELGAGIELATAAFPQLFLPMACIANVVKNVAAVTSTSTRTPIYKAYAKGENIGDVTAKGESVGNIADLLGTGLSILISKSNPSLVTSFAFLSCGYLFSSYHEVRSVVLNTLNRARFTVAVDSFIKTGYVPTLKDGNSQETIFNPPWRHEPVAIGSRFGEAFQEPASFIAIKPLFEDERYIVTYNPTKDKVYALLKDQAKPDDILKAAFHAHVLLHFINASHANLNARRRRMNSNRSYQHNPVNMDFLPHIEESCKIVMSSYGVFKKKAREQNCNSYLVANKHFFAPQGWIMSESLLNPGRARLCGVVPQ